MDARLLQKDLTKDSIACKEKIFSSENQLEQFKFRHTVNLVPVFLWAYVCHGNCSINPFNILADSRESTWVSCAAAVSPGYYPYNSWSFTKCYEWAPRIPWT